MAHKFFAALNHGDPVLEPIVTQVKAGQENAAVRAIFAEIQKRERRYRADFLPPLPLWNEETRHEADAALTGTFTLQGVTGTVPRRDDGDFDWEWDGPNEDPEFGWFLNRLHHIPALFVAWRETQDARYRTALNAQLRDWLRQNPRPTHYTFSSSWRALEVARRMEESWMPVLFAPQANEALDDDVLVGMLADVPEHAYGLRDYHSFSGNHLTTEMTSLASIALAFPEFIETHDWLEYALTEARAEAEREFYPDGAETELSNMYDQVVLQELQRLTDMLAAAGRDKEVADLRPLVEKSWNYFAHTLDPRGHGPLGNDSSLGEDAALVRQMAAKYNRPDWQYIATNGREGTAPAGMVSEYFPYAGLAVMRSGWDAGAQWAFFDAGPRGSDHQHADRLHLSVGANGREFLVDDGRYNYQPGPWRDYFTGPEGHNVVLLDGQGTMRPPETVRTPGEVRHEITKDWDFFAATAPFSGKAARGQGPAYHTRAVLYVRNHYWVVVDRILDAGPHTVDVLWHFHPDCVVKNDGDLVYTANPGQVNFGLLALKAPAKGWKVDLVRGRETPTPQGWYSPVFNMKEAATCADFSGVLAGPHTFVWVLWTTAADKLPSEARPQVTITEDNPARVGLTLQWSGQPTARMQIPLEAATPVGWRQE